MSEKAWKEFGAQLRRARLSCGYIQSRLASRCGMSAGTISNIERGNHRPAVDSVQLLCSVPELNLTPPECYFQERRRVEARLFSLNEMAAATDVLTSLAMGEHLETVRRAVDKYASLNPSKAQTVKSLFARILARKEFAS